MEKQNKIRKNVTFSLSEETIENLNRLKKESGMSKSAIIEHALSSDGEDNSDLKRKYDLLTHNIALFKNAMENGAGTSMSLEWALENLLVVE